MTTVTVELDDDLVAKATEALARRDSTLTREIEETVRRVAQSESVGRAPGETFSEFLKRFARYDTGGPYTRDEMNER